MTTTIITTTRIETFAAEAGAAGDILMAAICRRALGEGPDSYESFALDSDEHAMVDAMSRREAREEVARILLA